MCRWLAGAQYADLAETRQHPLSNLNLALTAPLVREFAEFYSEIERRGVLFGE